MTFFLLPPSAAIFYFWPRALYTTAQRKIEDLGVMRYLVMSKVPIFRISKSKFLLFQEW